MKRKLPVLFLALILNSHAQINLTSSLQACYALDGNANDPVNSFNGTLSAVTSTVNRFNTPNSAYYFSGSNSSYIKLPNNSLLKPNEITFSAWVKVNALNSTMDVVFTKNSFSSYFTAYGLCVINTGPNYKFAVYRQSGSGDNFVNSTTSVSINTWYHVAFSVNNTAMKIYVNGALEGSVVPTILSFNYDPTRDVILGGTNESSYNDPWHGTIDNARFYNRILSGPEIAALYTQDPSCYPNPVASFSVSPANICPGKTVTLTDLSTNTPTAWVWQTPGGSSTISTVNSPTIIFPNPGTYTVSLTSFNAAGSSNTSTQAVVVLPIPTLNIVSNPNVLCGGQSATLTASGASTYSWGVGQQGANFVVTPNQTTTYTVTGTHSNGCTAIGSKNIVVDQLPTMSISGNTVICEGASTSLLVSGTALTYSWSNGNAGNLISVSPAASTVYTVTGISINGCVNSLVQPVFVNINPVVTTSASSNPVCLGDPLVLSGGGASTYTWTGGITNNIAFYPTTTSNYTVTGTGGNSCKASATVQVAVNPKPVLTTSSSVSANNCPGEPIILSVSGANTYSWSTGDVTPMVTVNPTITSSFTVTGTDANGCKAVFVFVQNVNTCLGIEKGSPDESIKIYPNPFSNEVTVSNGNSETLRIEIYNIAGEKLQESILVSSINIVDLNMYPFGVYFVKIYDRNTLVKQQKLIKIEN